MGEHLGSDGKWIRFDIEQSSWPPTLPRPRTTHAHAFFAVEMAAWSWDSALRLSTKRCVREETKANKKKKSKSKKKKKSYGKKKAVSTAGRRE